MERYGTTHQEDLNPENNQVHQFSPELGNQFTSEILCKCVDCLWHQTQCNLHCAMVGQTDNINKYLGIIFDLEINHSTCPKTKAKSK